MVKPFVKTRKLRGADADKAIRLIRKNTLTSTQENELFQGAKAIIKAQYKTASGVAAK